jgi:hypothetical protein
LVDFSALVEYNRNWYLRDNRDNGDSHMATHNMDIYPYIIPQQIFVDT